MPTRDLLPGEFIVLGLLRLRPMHAYEMARMFESEGLDEVCPVEQSMLYTYVRNIEERGLIAYQETRVGRRPPRKIYELTEGGLAEVNAWLGETVERMREVRLDFLLKLYFLHLLDPESERILLARQVAVCEAYGERLSAKVAASEGFERLVAQSKASAAEATSRWLREYAWELEHGARRSHVEGSHNR